MKKGLRWKIAQFLEVRWWRNYLSEKDKTSYYSWKKEYWYTFLSKHSITIPRNQRILDAGCGPAGIFTVLQDHQVVALDPLLGYYQAQLPLFEPTDWPWVTFHKSSLEDFQVESPFNLVFCLNAINHVADLGKSLNGLSEVCTSNGTLYLSVDVHRWRFFRWLFGLVPVDILHPHQYTSSEYVKRMEVSGFRISQVRTIKKEFFFNYILIVANKSA